MTAGLSSFKFYKCTMTAGQPDLPGELERSCQSVMILHWKLEVSLRFQVELSRRGDRRRPGRPRPPPATPKQMPWLGSDNLEDSDHQNHMMMPGPASGCQALRTQ